VRRSYEVEARSRWDRASPFSGAAAIFMLIGSLFSGALISEETSAVLA
jgi:hypothetical protein